MNNYVLLDLIKGSLLLSLKHQVTGRTELGLLAFA